MTIAAEIGIVLLLIVFNGFLAMSELAVVSSRKARLRAMADAGSRGARSALALAAHPGRFLSAVQIGITLVGILAGAFSGATVATRLSAWLATASPAVAPYASEIALVLVVGAVTYLSLIVGELVPKRIALANPERMAALAARPMRAIAWVAAPLVWLLEKSSHAVMSLLRMTPRDPAMSEEELKALIGESTAAGVLAPEENRMIRAVMRFADRRVRTILTPRTEVDWLDLNATREAVVARIRASRHSRYPVCRGTVDELAGVVVAKDILDLVLQGRAFDLHDLAREVLVVPENAGALGVLERLKQAPIHMAVVVDEYGAMAGVVTATDILAELVGGMAEHGEVWEAQALRRPDGSWLIDGDMDAVRAAELLALADLGAQRGYVTLAGYVLDAFRRLPREGEAVERDGFRFEVVDMDGRRIDKVLVTPPAPTPTPTAPTPPG